MSAKSYCSGRCRACRSRNRHNQRIGFFCTAIAVSCSALAVCEQLAEQRLLSAHWLLLFEPCKVQRFCDDVWSGSNRVWGRRHVQCDSDAVQVWPSANLSRYALFIRCMVDPCHSKAFVDPANFVKNPRTQKRSLPDRGHRFLDKCLRLPGNKDPQ